MMENAVVENVATQKFALIITYSFMYKNLHTQKAMRNLHATML